MDLPEHAAFFAEVADAHAIWHPSAQCFPLCRLRFLPVCCPRAGALHRVLREHGIYDARVSAHSAWQEAVYGNANGT